MKMLKCILLIYAAVIAVFLLGCYICLPVILSEYFNDDKYLFLFLINIPIFIGVILYHTGSAENYTRPKRD